MWDLRDEIVSSLAYGRQRQLEMALCLASEPELLMLDEPSCGLTTTESADITARIRGAGLQDHGAYDRPRHGPRLRRGRAHPPSALRRDRRPRAPATRSRSNEMVRDIYMGAHKHRRPTGERAMIELQMTSTPGTATATCSRAYPCRSRTRPASLSWAGTAWERRRPSVPSLGSRRRAGAPSSSNGQNIVGLPPFRIARLGIGLVPQGRMIFPSLSVTENLTMAARTGDKQDPWTLEKVFTLFPKLKERSKNKGNLLSGGEQQMLTIARALMTNPDLILLDEPSEGLAPIVVAGGVQGDRAAQGERATRSSWWSRTSAWRWKSPTTSTS